MQFRSIERENGCSSQELRATLAAVFEEARKNNVAFADLLDQRVQTAKRDVRQEKRRR
jgi:hypothetical protein